MGGRGGGLDRDKTYSFGELLITNKYIIIPHFKQIIQIMATHNLTQFGG